MKLNKLKELSSKVLNVGKQKLKINTSKYQENKEQVDKAITKQDVRDIVSKGVVFREQDTGHSRGRARKILAQKKLKRKKGPGKKRGTPKARNKKNIHNLKVRGLRKRLQELKDEGKLNDKKYSKLYLMITGNYFRGKKHLEEYINGEKK
jgi:large subunit ribosomal protein L19e